MPLRIYKTLRRIKIFLHVISPDLSSFDRRTEIFKFFNMDTKCENVPLSSMNRSQAFSNVSIQYFEVDEKQWNERLGYGPARKMGKGYMFNNSHKLIYVRYVQ